MRPSALQHAHLATERFAVTLLTMTGIAVSFNSGVSIEVARRRLSHASIETTQVYTLLADKVADTEIRASSSSHCVQSSASFVP